ncbi:MAG: leucyl/phenylalanyl-tRNA--protein transferase [Isosphaeraceae bacterium]|nr:leucyl/phenylalanyl-tRNA--protein transferase [Isosphaeraceae bacterium]
MKLVALEGMGPIYLLDRHPVFPAPTQANEEGLLAMGGDLSVDRLLEAYRHGIFPWYEAGEPILWWSPDPRAILETAELRISRSLRAVLRRGDFDVRYDTAFDQVIHACATTARRDQEGSWISTEVRAAYTALHDLGVCHSVEIWHGDELVGGLYGVCLGSCFFGESMFSRQSNASKVALVGLARRLTALGIGLIDCQIVSEHLLSLGAKNVPRSEFLRRLDEAVRHPASRGSWAGYSGELRAQADG